MKLYTNTVPFSGNNYMPCIDDNMVIINEEELAVIPEGTIFKMHFIDHVNVYLKYRGKFVSVSGNMFPLFFKETEIDI